MFHSMCVQWVQMEFLQKVGERLELGNFTLRGMGVEGHMAISKGFGRSERKALTSP